MKKFFTLITLAILTTGLMAQENTQQIYIMLEFMQVDDTNNSDYWEVEEFWTEIHKQRVADNNILGWDLWSLTPSGSKQGSQYMTATLYSSLEGMMSGMTSEKFDEYLTKAHPNLTDQERNDMMAKTVLSRDIAHQVFCKEISQTSGNFDMKLGTLMTMDIMKQLDSDYEEIENEIFKPWHQQMTDEGQKGSWGLLATILPSGSEAYATHIAFSMYTDIKQLATFMESSGPKMDKLTQLAVQKGLESRERKEMKIARLVMMAR